MSIITTIGLFFKFFDEIMWLIKKLSKTGEEKRGELMAHLQQEEENFSKTNRPKWD